MAELRDPFDGPDGSRPRKIRGALAPLGDLAGLFADMCVIDSNQEQFAAAPALVMHCLRELLSALRGVLDPGGRRRRGEPPPPRPDLRGDLAALLVEHGIADDEVLLDDLEARVAPRTGEADHIRQIGAALALDPRIVDKWIGLKPFERAHRHGLNVAAIGEAYRTTFSDAIDVLDAITRAWTRQWPRIEALIEQAAAAPEPNRDLAKRLRVAVPTNPPVQDAMFDRLDPRWIPVLRREGVIGDPRSPAALAGRRTRCRGRPAGFSPAPPRRTPTPLRP